ncbi:MAG: hypothetical protein PHF58_12735, partial [Methylotenera sp.]|nr:hypothetical protein [Methylotenera sp.]
STFAGAKYIHPAGVTGCATCHNGATAPGKPGNHIQTTAACETCHKSTSTFAGATMNHTNVVAGTCSGCHNGSSATGRPSNHVPIAGLSCDVCHTSTSNFGSTTKPNHSLLAGMTCRGCHGANYSGVESKSHNSPKDCNASGCHNTSTFDK